MTIMGLLKWISLFLHIIIWNDTVCCISSLQQTPEGKFLILKQETMKRTGKTELAAREVSFLCCALSIITFCSLPGQKRTWRPKCFIALMATRESLMGWSIVKRWAEGGVPPTDGVGRAGREEHREEQRQSSGVGKLRLISALKRCCGVVLWKMAGLELRCLCSCQAVRCSCRRSLAGAVWCRWYHWVGPVMSSKWQWHQWGCPWGGVGRQGRCRILPVALLVWSQQPGVQGKGRGGRQP